MCRWHSVFELNRFEAYPPLQLHSYSFSGWKSWLVVHSKEHHYTCTCTYAKAQQHHALLDGKVFRMVEAAVTFRSGVHLHVACLHRGNGVFAMVLLEEQLLHLHTGHSWWVWYAEDQHFFCWMGCLLTLPHICLWCSLLSICISGDSKDMFPSGCTASLLPFVMTPSKQAQTVLCGTCCSFPARCCTKALLVTALLFTTTNGQKYSSRLFEVQPFSSLGRSSLTAWCTKCILHSLQGSAVRCRKTGLFQTCTEGWSCHTGVTRIIRMWEQLHKGLWMPPKTLWLPKALAWSTC